MKKKKKWCQCGKKISCTLTANPLCNNFVLVKYQEIKKGETKMMEWRCKRMRQSKKK